MRTLLLFVFALALAGCKRTPSSFTTRSSTTASSTTASSTTASSTTASSTTASSTAPSSTAPSSTAPSSVVPSPPAAPAVILVTLGGVRPTEFFGRPDPTLCRAPPAQGTPECTRQGYLFDRVLAEHATRGFLWGAPESNTEARIANTARRGLPAIQTLFTGAPTSCADDTCPRVTTETVGERLRRELHLPLEDVAFFASQEALSGAIEKTPGTTLCNTGLTPVRDPTANVGELAALNERQRLDRPPWPDARGDWWTMAQALRHLRDHRPRFLYIGLHDADAWAQRGDYRQYLGALRLYDEWLGRLLTTLDGMGDYGHRVSVFITTDHGRGAGSRWHAHGTETPEADTIFLLAVPPGDPMRRTVRTRSVTHLDLRPTIEAIFDLTPLTCVGCGHPIAEIVEASRVAVSPSEATP